MADAAIKLVVGLGNPGTDYEATRHNIGFLALDALVSALSGSAHDTSSPQKKKKGLSSSLFARKKTPYVKVRCESLVYQLELTNSHNSSIVLAKPQVYMNRSGRSVKGLLKHYDIAVDEVLVIHDDLDLETGIIRVKVGGGHGGHNGLRSIIDSCGPDFARIKVGIGRPPGQMPAERYVLQPLKGTALEELHVDANRAADCAQAVLDEGILAAQNTYNVRD